MLDILFLPQAICPAAFNIGNKWVKGDRLMFFPKFKVGPQLEAAVLVVAAGGFVLSDEKEN